MSRKIFLLAPLPLLLLGLLRLYSSQQRDPKLPALFVRLEKVSGFSEDDWKKKDKTVVRAQPVAVNFDLLYRATELSNGHEARMSIALFDSPELIAVLNQYRKSEQAAGVSVWRGTVETANSSRAQEKALGSIFISAKANPNIAVIDIRTPEQDLFKVRSGPNGTYHVLLEIDESKFPQSAPGVPEVGQQPPKQK